MLSENNEEDKSFQSRKLNLQAKYESLVIVPQDPTEKSCVPPCDNCVCNSESQNSDDVPPLEEDHSSPLKEDPTSPFKQDENQEISKENLTEKEFERENNEQLEQKEEQEEELKEKENKNTNLEESIIDKELKKQKECIIV
jgi:hypothetical protein